MKNTRKIVMMAVLAAAVWSVPSQTMAAPRRMSQEAVRHLSADATRRTAVGLDARNSGFITELVRRIQPDWWMPRLQRMPARWLPEGFRSSL